MFQSEKDLSSTARFFEHKTVFINLAPCGLDLSNAVRPISACMHFILFSFKRRCCYFLPFTSAPHVIGQHVKMISSYPTNLHQLWQQQKWCMLSKAVWPYHSWGFWVLFQGGYLRSCKATPPLHPDGCIFISGAVSALHRETGNRTGHGRRAKQASWSAPNHRLKKCENKYIFKFNPHFAWGATTYDSKASKFILGDFVKIHQDYSLYYAVTYCVCCKMVVKMDKSSVATEKTRHTLYILHLKYAHLQSLLLYCQPPVGQWVSWPCPSVPQSHSTNNKWVPLKIKSDKKELQKKNESIKTWMVGTHLHVVIKYIQKAIVFIIIWGGEGGTSQKHGAGVMKVKLLHRRRWRKLYIKR